MDAEPEGFATGGAVVENRGGGEFFGEVQHTEFAGVDGAGKVSEGGEVKGGAGRLLDSEPIGEERW